MKFSEAVEKLKSGSKITRIAWNNEVYFQMRGNQLKAFQPSVSNYFYGGYIMISDGWILDDSPEEYKFYDIIPMLVNGSTAKLKDWSDMYITLDRSTKMLVVHSIEEFPFSPQFIAFLAEDWIEIS